MSTQGTAHTTLDLRLPPDLGERLATAVSGFAASVREMGRVVGLAGLEFGRALNRLNRRVVEAANTPEVIAGLQGRYLVRAGVDPAYRTDAALDALVRSILGGEEPGLGLVLPANRALVAAAAIQGWTVGHPAPPVVLSWHRRLGDRSLVVTRG